MATTPSTRAGRVAGHQIEARPVQPAFEGAAVELALGQGHVGVGAGVVDAVHDAVVGAHERDEATVDVGGRRPHLGEFVEPADQHPLPVCRGVGLGAHTEACSSSRSMAAMRRSWTSGTPIRATTEAKKPRTTRRRAWSSGIPRAIR